MDTAVGEEGTEGSSVSHLLFVAIWAAAGLGLLAQLVSIAARLSVGAKIPGGQMLVDVVGGISWSVIVCGALSLGVTASRNAGELTMGLLGALGAPLGFSVAKGAQRGVQWMADMPGDQIGTLVFVTAGLKAAEYALLGYMLSRLLGTPRSTPRNHVLLGAAFGLVFGGLILAANMKFQGALPTVKIVGLTTNEFLFPVGCSVLIYWFARLTNNLNVRTQLLAGH